MSFAGLYLFDGHRFPISIDNSFSTVIHCHRVHWSSRQLWHKFTLHQFLKRFLQLMMSVWYTRLMVKALIKLLEVFNTLLQMLTFMSISQMDFLNERITKWAQITNFTANNTLLFKFLSVNWAVHIKQDITTFHCGKKFNGIAEFRGTYHVHEIYQLPNPTPSCFLFDVVHRFTWSRLRKKLPFDWFS